MSTFASFCSVLSRFYEVPLKLAQLSQMAQQDYVITMDTVFCTSSLHCKKRCSSVPKFCQPRKQFDFNHIMYKGPSSIIRNHVKAWVAFGQVQTRECVLLAYSPSVDNWRPAEWDSYWLALALAVCSALAWRMPLGLVLYNWGRNRTSASQITVWPVMLASKASIANSGEEYSLHAVLQCSVEPNGKVLPKTRKFIWSINSLLLNSSANVSETPGVKVMPLFHQWFRNRAKHEARSAMHLRFGAAFPTFKVRHRLPSWLEHLTWELLTEKTIV